MRGYLFVLLVAAAVTYLTTPAARRFARRIGAITPVRDRDVHTVPIPRLGGTAIFLGIAVAIVTASQIPFFEPVFTRSQQHNAPWVVLLSAAAVCLLGVMDDLWSLDALTKLAGQALAAGVLAWQGFQLVSLPIFGLIYPSPGLLIVLTVLAVVVTINAVNFVDGLDGLAAGIVAIAGAAFFIYSYLLTRNVSNNSDNSSLAALITAALVGACIGFLPHNFNPARIFMGDSGSMLIGLLLATSTVAITVQVDPFVLKQARIVPAFLPVVLPLAVLALPLIDLSLAVIRRTRAGRSPFQPDKMHLHHRMLALGHGHVSAVLILYLWTATVAFGVALFALLPPVKALVVGGVAVFSALVLTTGPMRGRRTRRAATTTTGEAGPAPDGGEGGLSAPDHESPLSSSGAGAEQQGTPEPPIAVPGGAPPVTNEVPADGVSTGAPRASG